MKAFSRIAAGVTLVALLGCGGGGGGGGGGQGPVQFSGNTNPALISTSNAAVLAANATNSSGGTDIAQVLSGAAPGGEPRPGQGLVDVGRRVSHAVRAMGVKPRATADARATSVAVNDVLQCPDGGTATVSGDVTPSGTGTVNVTFSTCRVGGDSLNGAATLRIDQILTGPGPDDVRLIDITVSFARLSLRGSVNLDIGGQVRVQVDLPFNKETITENIVAQNFDTGRMARADITVVDTYDNLDNPSSFTESISGRVFDSIHGFVDIVTLADLRFPTVDQPFPSGGELVLSGQGNQRVHVLPNSATRVTLGLDFDGTVGIDRLVRLAWADLTRPIAADLADNDGDGMHNSWETAFGLNPNVPDAADDDLDADGFSNLAEYQDGGNPTNAAVIPMLTVGAPNPVANAVPGRSTIAFDGTNYLLVSCRGLGDPGFFGVLISETGRILRNFHISSGPCNPRPAVAFGGGNYLVALTRGPQLLGFRVTPAGDVLNPLGDPIGSSLTDGSSGNDFPSVAFDGTNFLVVWSKSGGVLPTRIHAARVSTGAPPFVLNDFPVTSGAHDSLPAVAFDGTNYLVVWTSGFFGLEDVRGARVSPAGTVLDSTPIPIATGPSSEIAGGVAFDGTNYLVVWNQAARPVFPPPDGQIFGRRLAKDGTLVDGTAIQISTGLFQNHSSSVAFAGNSFLVTWGVGQFSAFSPAAGIFATRVSKAGVRMDGQPGELGVTVSGPPPSSSFSSYVEPVAGSNGRSALITWVTNTGLPDRLDEILAAPVSGL